MLLAFAAAGVTLAGSLDARAQANAADAQFDYGLAEMQAGRLDSGCPALAESYRLDPKPGSLFTLAECEARWGKIATALTHYEAYLDVFARMTPEQKERQWGREKIATTRRDELRSKVPTLALVAKRLPKGTVVKRDGVPLGPTAIGTRVPVDPGRHEIEILVPGRPPRIEHVDAAAGDTVRLILDAPEEPAPAPAPPPPPTTPAPAATPSATPSATPAAASAPPAREGEPPASTPLSPYRIGAFAAAGVGAVGLGVGIAFGLVTLGHKSTIDAHCNDTACDAEGKQAGDSAHASGAMSTAGFVVGGVGIVAAITLLVLEPPKPATAFVRPTLAVGPGQGSVGLGGAF